MCTSHVSRLHSHSKSARTNIATFHSPNAHSQDVLKRQMLSRTKKPFTTFPLMCSVAEKAETTLTSVDLFDLSTLLLSPGTGRAAEAAAAPSGLAAARW